MSWSQRFQRRACGVTDCGAEEVLRLIDGDGGTVNPLREKDDCNRLNAVQLESFEVEVMLLLH